MCSQWLLLAHTLHENCTHCVLRLAISRYACCLLIATRESPHGMVLLTTGTGGGKSTGMSNDIIHKKCEKCGALFTPRGVKRFCSDYCARKSQKKRARQRTAPVRLAKYQTWFEEQQALWANSRRRRQKRRLSFAERIEAGTIFEPNTGCRLWLGMIDNYGYARIKIKGRSIRLHRKLLEDRDGPLPKGVLALHRCGVSSCVEIGHLYAGTVRDNFNDMVRHGRHDVSGLKRGR